MGKVTPRLEISTGTQQRILSSNILHSMPAEYGVDEISKMMKIKYYQDGISDLFFNLVCLFIQTSLHLFQTIDQVKDHYTIFKQTTSTQDNPGTVRRGISSIGQGGPRGRGGRGSGNDHDACKPTQDTIDACTHIKAKRYGDAE